MSRTQTTDKPALHALPRPKLPPLAPQTLIRAVHVLVALLLAGGVYLAVTRADALLLDLSVLAGCM